MFYFLSVIEKKDLPASVDETDAIGRYIEIPPSTPESIKKRRQTTREKSTERAGLVNSQRSIEMIDNILRSSKDSKGSEDKKKKSEKTEMQENDSQE